jgi:hypothetical protein
MLQIITCYKPLMFMQFRTKVAQACNQLSLCQDMEWYSWKNQELYLKWVLKQLIKPSHACKRGLREVYAYISRLAAFKVFFSSIAIVNGPTPPGTGVI